MCDVVIFIYGVCVGVATGGCSVGVGCVGVWGENQIHYPPPQSLARI